MLSIFIMRLISFLLLPSRLLVIIFQLVHFSIHLNCSAQGTVESETQISCHKYKARRFYQQRQVAIQVSENQRLFTLTSGLNFLLKCIEEFEAHRCSLEQAKGTRERTKSIQLRMFLQIARNQSVIPTVFARARYYRKRPNVRPQKLQLFKIVLMTEVFELLLKLVVHGKQKEQELDLVAFRICFPAEASPLLPFSVEPIFAQGPVNILDPRSIHYLDEGVTVVFQNLLYLVR